ncbi:MULTISPECIES: DUF6232 family protein [unclassified Streptomyces]|uniref:DUF6232 family protein n=1 Tax=unclassified Streptomyces TaxID=2593676 RepID=UPI0008DD7037|nr:MULTISPECIES: DUF6232 family protein [unclassified Streptomyces]OII64483.1 hypothetical protein BJP39_01775 [Streptomyces sp. CC77]
MSQITINDGVLWVGGDAYPLRNISHVAKRGLVVNTGKAWKDFFQMTFGWLIVGGIIAAVFDTIGMIILLGVEGLIIWSLVSDLRKPPLYGLILNTSGTQFDAVWSTSEKEIDALVAEVARALGHPDTAQVVFNVEHAVQGDVINQYGDHSIGKAQHYGQGNIGGR